MTLITTNTTTSGASSVFTSGIDSTYKLYIFKFIDIDHATNLKRFSVQFNVAGQSGFNEYITSTHFDAYHHESGDPYGPEIRYEATTDQAQGTAYQNLASGHGTGSDECLAGELFLFNPSGFLIQFFFQGKSIIYFYNSTLFESEL